MPDNLKSYPPTWKGDLLLACRKCQKKLKGKPGTRALAKLKRTIKRLNEDHEATQLHLISVPCMDLCPKGAVTICIPTGGLVTLSILRSRDQIDDLYRHPRLAE